MKLILALTAVPLICASHGVVENKALIPQLFQGLSVVP